MSKKNDPFESVEVMLKWQIDEADHFASRLFDEIEKYGEVYTFSNSNQQSAFGVLTHKQLSLIQARQSFKLIQAKINKARASLKQSDLALTIYVLIDIYKSINSMNASWTSVSSVKAFKYVDKDRKAKRRSGSNLKKSLPNKDELLKYRDNYPKNSKGNPRGWITSAALEFSMDEGTIRQRIKES